MSASIQFLLPIFNLPPAHSTHSFIYHDDKSVTKSRARAQHNLNLFQIQIMSTPRSFSPPKKSDQPTNQPTNSVRYIKFIQMNAKNTPIIIILTTRSAFFIIPFMRLSLACSINRENSGWKWTWLFKMPFTPAAASNSNKLNIMRPQCIESVFVYIESVFFSIFIFV